MQTQCVTGSRLRSSIIAPAKIARRSVLQPVGVPCLARRGAVQVVAAGAGMLPREEHNMNGNNSGDLGAFSPQMSVPNVTMAGAPNYGSGGSLGATMERARLNFVMPTPVVQGPKLDDGGDGGDIGKINRNGGGGDGGGGDDDDDYFNGEDGDGDGEGGEGQRGIGFFRLAIPESYDKLSIGAVFAEWMRTVQDLPAILRQAVTMGLFSSAQLVRFFAMDVRPNVTRLVSRRLPPSLAREFVGRLMADPGFVQKMVLEASFSAAASLWYEYRLRGEKLKDEWDLAAINTIGMAAATAATVWLLAPSRSYGSIQKFPWQQMLDGLPNCVFDASGPLRQYTKQARAVGFLAKMAELSAVGALTGTLTSVLSSAAVAVKQKSNPEWQPSTEVPSLGRSSAGLAAFFALNANTRYQLVGGLDRFLFDRTSFLWTYVALSGAARLVSNQVGELSRPWWQGLPAPSSLAAVSAPALPMPRKIRKKVKKVVPKSRLQQDARATMATAAAVAGVGGQLEGAAEQLAPVAVELEAPATLLEAATPLEVEAEQAPLLASQEPFYTQQGVTAQEELQGAYQYQPMELEQQQGESDESAGFVRNYEQQEGEEYQQQGAYYSAQPMSQQYAYRQ